MKDKTLKYKSKFVIKNMFIHLYILITSCKRFTKGYYIIKVPNIDESIVGFDNNSVKSSKRKMPDSKKSDNLIKFERKGDGYVIKFVKNGRYLCSKEGLTIAYLCDRKDDPNTLFKIEDYINERKIIRIGNKCLNRMGYQNGSTDEYLGIESCYINRPKDWIIKKVNKFPKMKPEKKKYDFKFGAGELKKDKNDNIFNDKQKNNNQPLDSDNFNQPKSNILNTKENNIDNQPDQNFNSNLKYKNQQQENKFLEEPKLKNGNKIQMNEKNKNITEPKLEKTAFSSNPDSEEEFSEEEKDTGELNEIKNNIICIFKNELPVNKLIINNNTEKIIPAEVSSPYYIPLSIYQ